MMKNWQLVSFSLSTFITIRKTDNNKSIKKMQNKTFAIIHSSSAKLYVHVIQERIFSTPLYVLLYLKSFFRCILKGPTEIRPVCPGTPKRPPHFSIKIIVHLIATSLLIIL